MSRKWKRVEMKCTCAYNPEISIPGELQTITVYLPPLYIMSPRIKVYRAKDIFTYKGYVSKFQFGPNEESEEPFAVITIVPEVPNESGAQKALPVEVPREAETSEHEESPHLR